MKRHNEDKKKTAVINTTRNKDKTKNKKIKAKKKTSRNTHYRNTQNCH